MMLAHNQHNFTNSNHRRHAYTQPFQHHDLFAAATNLNQVPDLMPSADAASWGHMASQHTPRAAHRLGHHRESSLSSLGSNGPTSPYANSTSNPHIAITGDSALADAYQDLAAGADANYSYGKTLSSNDNYYANAMSAFNAGNDRSLALPSESSAPRGSHPTSVASSIAGGDSPATPPSHDVEQDSRRRGKNTYPVAKLSRTMTDIFGDELYNPHFAMTMSPPPQAPPAVSPTNELFAQRLQAANKQHLSAAHSPVSTTSRGRSPFRNDSPHFAPLDDFSAGLLPTKVEPVQQQCDVRRDERERQAQQQLTSKSVPQQQAMLRTISPKDAVLELNETDEMNNFPLFDPSDTSMSYSNVPMQSQQQQQSQALHVQQPLMPRVAQTYHQNMTTATPLQNGFNFSMPTSIQMSQQMPQQYPFVPRPAQQSTTVSLPSRVSSMEGSVSDFVADGPVQRPARTTADGGTYTCTYHGCTRRFDTPALLQKHKREGHRQANALSSLRGPVAVPDNSMAGNLLNSQAGPHKCERTNPSTGKPCNTIFSRPYDLTRHEDTIHNARKQKVRCELCTEEKTFSRADALTRHFRVCHPDVEFPGKHRRRGGATA
ncbi:protein RPN4 [Microdochium nivale]|nr:protein RPN4 [Microdochium nivale]